MKKSFSSQHSLSSPLVRPSSYHLSFFQLLQKRHEYFPYPYQSHLHSSTNMKRFSTKISSLLSLSVSSPAFRPSITSLKSFRTCRSSLTLLCFTFNSKFLCRLMFASKNSSSSSSFLISNTAASTLSSSHLCYNESMSQWVLESTSFTSS